VEQEEDLDDEDSKGLLIRDDDIILSLQLVISIDLIQENANFIQILE
jgi:hypothetical protein